jgi:hypothetical protein
MSESLYKILESKRALRRKLASRPAAEKLRILDAMREREMAIRLTDSRPRILPSKQPKQ